MPSVMEAQRDGEGRRQCVMAHDDEALDSLDSLDSLLRLWCQQGQAEISWDDLRGLCEDAVVAAGHGAWDVCPQEAHVVVADLATHLAGWVAQHYTQRDQLGPVGPTTRQGRFSVLGLVRILGTVQGGHEDGGACGA